MQTIFIISIFTLVLTILTGIMSDGTSNTKQLNEQRIAETHQFFENIAKVDLNDITLSQMHGNPAKVTGADTPENFIKSTTQLSQLSSGRLADPSLDAWGKPIKGFLITQYLSLTSAGDTQNVISVPVTGVVLVSGGPDGVIQTTIPTATATTPLSAIYGVVVPTSAGGVPTNDDVIYSYDNRTAQQDALKGIRARMDRIATAALKEYEARLSDYRQTKMAQYKLDIAAGKDVPPSVLDLSTDPNAPVFLTIDNSSDGLKNRRKLGVDEDFAILERVLDRGGSLSVSAPAPANATLPLVITVKNNTTAPTPWGPGNSLKIQLKVYAQVS